MELEKRDVTLEEKLHCIGRVRPCYSHFISLKTLNCTWNAILHQRTLNKQAVLVDPVSQPLTPDVVFLLLPVFGLETNHSFKALMITYHQVWLHPSLLAFSSWYERFYQQGMATASKGKFTLDSVFYHVILQKNCSSDDQCGSSKTRLPRLKQMLGRGNHLLLKRWGLCKNLHFWWTFTSHKRLISDWSRRLFGKQTDLDDIVVAVLSMDGLHCTDIEATKHLRAGVHPHPISGTQWHQKLIKPTIKDPLEEEIYVRFSKKTDFSLKVWNTQKEVNYFNRSRFQCISESAHLSVIAICSNMAEPVLAFQFPEMDVLLKNTEKTQMNQPASG